MSSRADTISPLARALVADSRQDNFYNRPMLRSLGLGASPDAAAAAAAQGGSSGFESEAGTTKQPSQTTSRQGSQNRIELFDAGHGFRTPDSVLSEDREEFVHGCLLLLECARGDVAAVERAVDANPKLVNFWDYDRRSPAHVAASEGHHNVVAFLVGRGAKLNRSDRWGGSPLDDALRHDHHDIAEMLKAAGARLGAIDHWALLISAAAAGHVEDVRDILARSPDKSAVNACDYDSRTPLHLAATEDRAEVVELLLTKGADVKARDRWDNTALDAAPVGSASETLLLAAGSKRTPERRGTNARASAVAAFARADSKDLFVVDWRDVDLVERIGGGSFGTVHRATWRSTPVAAKVIKIDDAAVRESALEEFAAEAQILKKLRHPNICMLVGYTVEPGHELILAELMRCSLLDILKSVRAHGEHVSFPRAIRYAVELARGMRYLHEQNPVVLHRDLKPANLLLDASNTLRISDFGLATIRTRTESSRRVQPDKKAVNRAGSSVDDQLDLTGATGSYRFMAPEVALYKPYGRAVDVYSFAMILYYLLDTRAPWADYSGQRAARMAVQGTRPIVRRWWDPRIVKILKLCWDPNPQQRPSFHAILDMIEAADLEVEVSDVDASDMSKDGGCAHLHVAPASNYRRPSVKTHKAKPRCKAAKDRDATPSPFVPVAEHKQPEAPCCVVA